MACDNFDTLFGMEGLTDGADHVDVHTIEGRSTLCEFIVGMFNYQPCWMAVLWKIRARLLKVLGQGDQVSEKGERLTVETFPMTPGKSALFFTVTASDGETYWVAEARDKHLNASIAVAAEPIGESGRKRFSVGTVVFYNNWAGPIYFNIIRPFHHLVVACSIRAALRR